MVLGISIRKGAKTKSFGVLIQFSFTVTTLFVGAVSFYWEERTIAILTPILFLSLREL